MTIDAVRNRVPEKAYRFDNSRIGKVALQKALFVTLLRIYSQRIALFCPTGRGSGEDEPVWYVDSGMKKDDVFKIHEQEWTGVVH